MNPGRLLDLFDLWASEGPSPNLIKTLIRVISDKSLREFAGCVLEWDERAEIAESELEEVEYKLKEMTVRKNVAEAKLKDMQIQLSNASSRCRDKDSLKEELKELRGKSKNLERNNNDLKNEAKKNKILVRELNDRESKLLKVNDKLTHELKDAREQITEMTCVNKELQVSLSSLTTDMQHESRRQELNLIELQNEREYEVNSLQLKHEQTVLRIRDEANRNESHEFQRYRDTIQALESKHTAELTELRQSLMTRDSAPFSLFSHQFPDARIVQNSINCHEESPKKAAVAVEEVRECAVCEDADATVTLSPCGHKEMCVSCAYRWMQTPGGDTCPTCRTVITSWY